VPRDYSSPSRDQAKSDTRDQIIQAVVKVILEQGVHAFTVQTVADQAGVSHRTVYRHFPSRERLLEGLSDFLHQSVLAAGLPPPRDVAEMGARVGPLFEQFSRMKDAMRASVIAAVALQHQTELQRTASVVVDEMLAASFPALAREEVREAAAVLRAVISRYTWYVLSVDLDLEPAATARGVSWAVGALLDDLRRRNDAAARQTKRPKRNRPPR
jgi:AcrR family transcriptional regulator